MVQSFAVSGAGRGKIVADPAPNDFLRPRLYDEGTPIA
jgi:hypothetical protein